MFFNIVNTVVAITLLLGASLVPGVNAADCQNAIGVANGECVKYYSNGGCSDGDKIGQFKPTCEGNCFVFDSFQSLKVGGDGTFGTDCHVYSDTNCQNQLADSGNIVVGGGHCVNAANAKSMKCFYRC